MAKSKKGPPKHASKASSKRTALFKAKGGVQQQIKSRRKHQAFTNKVKTREMLKSNKYAKPKAAKAVAPETDEDDEEEGEENEEDVEMDDAQVGLDAMQDSQEEDSSEDDLESLQDSADEAVSHKMDLAKLKDKDPDFYKYLVENDKELLEFNEDIDDLEEASEPTQGPTVLTLPLLTEWQKILIASHSLKTLRKLLTAFKAAAIGDEQLPQGHEAVPFAIQDQKVFRKLILTTIKYTPIVLMHHVPVEKKANGKFKVQTQSKKYATVQRYIKSYFSSLTKIFESLDQTSEKDGTDSMARLACLESAKLIPFVVGNRKVAKGYIKLMMEQWATSAQDSVKVAAFIAIRAMAVAGDATLTELVYKTAYTTLISTFKQYNAYTAPAINLMKNSATELFLLPGSIAYQLAFTYIRSIALQLRAATKSQNKDAFQQVYNWQVIQAIDFWSSVLSAACDSERVATHGSSDLEGLIYPLAQIGLGVIRLLPTSRFFPLHFHVIRSLLRLTTKAGHFIPLAPSLLNMLSCPEFKRKPKPSTQLKNLDFEFVIRVPKAYLRTRTYADNLAEELAFALVEVFESQAKSIAFPELIIPSLITLKRFVKSSTAPKLTSTLKPVIEKFEANKTWIEKKRAKVEFSPTDKSQVDNFLAHDDEEAPLAAMLRREIKLRAKKRELLSKDADKDEILE